LTLLPQRKSFSVHISYIQTADIPSLIQVHDDAFASNLCNQLIDASMAGDRAAQLKKTLLEHPSTPNVAIIKAEIESAEKENTHSR